MKPIAAASTLVLTTLALASSSWAQAPSRSRPYDQSAAAAPAAYETERGTVTSVTPIVQQVAVPRQVCNDETVSVQRQPSGAGALIGAIAGGAMGNAVGAGAGRAAATAIGLIGGAAVGNSIESGGQGAQAQSVRRCTTESSYEDRTTAYSVVYEYGGRQYTTQMRQDPGRYVQVQVQATPEGEAAAPQYTPPARARSAPPVSSRPPPVYEERPVYRGYPGYPEPEYQSYPAPRPVYYGPTYYEPAYPQFGTGLVLGALIGYGAHYGHSRNYGHRWRGR
jgi:uncharacterized protein YcfJ